MVATGNQQVSDIYLGVVENVIPGIDAAFVNIGDAERNGFIHVTDLGHCVSNEVRVPSPNY